MFDIYIVLKKFNIENDIIITLFNLY